MVRVKQVFVLFDLSVDFADGDVPVEILRVLDPVVVHAAQDDILQPIAERRASTFCYCCLVRVPFEGLFDALFHDLKVCAILVISGEFSVADCCLANVNFDRRVDFRLSIRQSLCISVITHDVHGSKIDVSELVKNQVVLCLLRAHLKNAKSILA